MNTPSPALPPTLEPRICALLDAAVRVFARFGYRKTSMDDLARAAGVSRQGLYLSFANKEELFRRALEHSLSNQLKAAMAALSHGKSSVQARLITACLEWSGRFVGSLGTDASDLMCAGTALAGATLADYEWQFEEALGGAIRASDLAERCASAGLDTTELARGLHATARGLKQSCKTQEEFLRGMTAVVHLICKG